MLYKRRRCGDIIQILFVSRGLRYSQDHLCSMSFVLTTYRRQIIFCRKCRSHRQKNKGHEIEPCGTLELTFSVREVLEHTTTFWGLLDE